MEKDEIKDIIHQACNHLYETKMHLISEKANERTIVSHIANNLGTIIAGWDVDSDYNREGIDRLPKRNIDEELAYPDIIIHRHGSTGDNLAAIEVKGYWNKENRSSDEKKLRKLKEKHHYKFLFRIELSPNTFEIIEVES